MKGALALRNPVAPGSYVICATTTIPAASWLEVKASLEAACSAVMVQNTGDQPIVVGVGGAGSEVEKFVIPFQANAIIPIEIAKGARISVRSKSFNQTAQFVTINYLA